MKRWTKLTVIGALLASFFAAEVTAFAKRYPKPPKQHFKRTKTHTFFQHK